MRQHKERFKAFVACAGRRSSAPACSGAAPPSPTQPQSRCTAAQAHTCPLPGGYECSRLHACDCIMPTMMTPPPPQLHGTNWTQALTSARVEHDVTSHTSTRHYVMRFTPGSAAAKDLRNVCVPATLAATTHGLVRWPTPREPTGRFCRRSAVGGSQKLLQLGSFAIPVAMVSSANPDRYPTRATSCSHPCMWSANSVTKRHGLMGAFRVQTFFGRPSGSCFLKKETHSQKSGILLSHSAELYSTVHSSYS